MTAKQFSKLKVGDKVVWPEGANGCTGSNGSVFDNQYGNRGIMWEDGQETYPHDDYAIKFVVLSEIGGGL